MSHWPLLLLALVLRAQAAGAPAEPATEAGIEATPAISAPAEADTVAPPEGRLDSALIHYQAGRYEEARVELAALINDPMLTDAALRQQARVYLGEVLYVRGQQDAAFKVFETVLLEEPAYRVDPFRHPPDVCGFFEVVRASVAPMRPPTPTPVRLPVNANLGFGLYQLQHKQTGRGVAFLAGQSALGLASLATFAILLVDHNPDDAEDRAALARLRWAQWGTTAGFWGVYTWSVVDARVHWREEVPAQGQTGPTVGVGATARF